MDLKLKYLIIEMDCSPAKLAELVENLNTYVGKSFTLWRGSNCLGPLVKVTFPQVIVSTDNLRDLHAQIAVYGSIHRFDFLTTTPRPQLERLRPLLDFLKQQRLWLQKGFRKCPTPA